VNLWPALLVGAFGMSVVFAIAWAWAVKCQNYSLVDAVWVFGIGVLGVGWLLVAGGYGVKYWVAAGLVGIWSGRLGWHLQRRIRRSHPEEDARYAKLREVWDGRVVAAFFWFFQAQALSVVVLALPFLLIAGDTDSSWGYWETVGLFIALLGITGEGWADAQMSQFKAGNSDSKAVCQEGLWRFSRHPNYFFEAVIWLGFYTYACGSTAGWTMLHAPAAIIFLLVKVTGIPPTEAAAVMRKGDAYRRYQQSTSAFIPWFPKSNL
jgi:steroid 5-alpha reductase family enzyme